MIRSHKGSSRQWLRATLAFKGNSAPGQPGHSGSHTTAWSQTVSATPGGQGESLSGHQKVQMWGSQGKWGPRAYFPVGVETEIVLGGRRSSPGESLPQPSDQTPHLQPHPPGISRAEDGVSGHCPPKALQRPPVPPGESLRLAATT